MSGRTGSILIFGRDTMLLNTRRMMLQCQGYHAVAVSFLSELTALPLQPAFQLLILCHSVDPATANEALNLATLRWPSIECLSLVQTVPVRATSRPGKLVLALDGPKRFVESVAALVGKTQPADSRVA